MAQVTDLNIAAGTSFPEAVTYGGFTGVVGRQADMFALPSSETATAPTVPAVFTTLSHSEASPVIGALRLKDQAVGTERFLGLVTSFVTLGSTIMVYDRIAHYANFSSTVTTAQAFTVPTLPARDDNGQALGEGYRAMLVCQSAMGAGTPTLTLNYTNNLGVAGRVASNFRPVGTTGAAGSCYQFSLQSGDNGIGAGTGSLTLSATMTSGTLALVIYRPILVIPSIAANPVAMDIVTAGLQRLYPGATLCVTGLPAAAGANQYFLSANTINLPI